MFVLPEFTRHDTGAPLALRLRDRNGYVDLTGATARFTMWNKRTGIVKIPRATMVVLNQATTPGGVRYDWQAADVDTADTYLAEIEVTFIDGTKATWLSNDNMMQSIKPDGDNT